MYIIQQAHFTETSKGERQGSEDKWKVCQSVLSQSDKDGSKQQSRHPDMSRLLLFTAEQKLNLED